MADEEKHHHGLFHHHHDKEPETAEDFKKEEKEHKPKEHMSELGALAADGFAHVCLLFC